jgi:hypothetical protein
MADEQTPDDVRNEHVSRLGSDLGPVYNALWNDVASLHVKWREYREMFGSTPERIELLNSAAGLFFRIVQDTLWDDTLLHLCRLTDPPQSAGRSNLTLRALPPLVMDPLLRGEVSALVDQAVVATAFARDWRNRHLSHRDLALALNSGAQPLVRASRVQVSSAVAAIHAVLNKISERLLQSTLVMDVIAPARGAEAVLYVIRDGLEAGKARTARIQSGNFIEEDLRHRAV